MHPYRTHTCSELPRVPLGSTVRLSGYLTGRRDLGKILFLELGDANAAVQLVVTRPDQCRALRTSKLGQLMTVTGRLRSRGERNTNAVKETGSLEVALEAWEVWSAPPSDRPAPSVRGLARTLARAAAVARRTLDSLGFVEDVGREPLWGRRLSGRDALDRVARLEVGDEHLHVELSMSFCTSSDLFTVVEALVAPVLSTSDPAATIVRGTWEEAAEVRGPALVWAERPTRASRTHASFPHDPCVFLLARRFEGDEGRALPVLAEPVAGFELWSRGRCVGKGAIREHDPALLERLQGALEGQAPSVRARVAGQLAAASEGMPPCAVLSLDLGHLIAGRDGGDMSRDLARTADPQAACSHLEADLVRNALQAVLLRGDDVQRRAARAERRDTETATAVFASLKMRSTRDHQGSSTTPSVLGTLLTDSAISEAQCERVLDLFPAQKARVLAQAPEALYQWLWSVLGNDFVREVIDDPEAHARVRSAVGRGIVTEHRQLVYLDRAALGDLERVYVLSPEARAVELTATLRRLLAEQPSAFATAVAALVEAGSIASPRTAAALSRLEGDVLLAAAKRGLCTPHLLPLFLEAREGSERVETLVRALESQAEHIYPNRPVDAETSTSRLADSLTRLGFDDAHVDALRRDPGGALAEVVFFLYRPVNMNVRAIAATLARVEDCTHHFAEAGIRPGGPHWDPRRECYAVPIASMGGASLRLYPSKNRVSLFAKAAAGLCTARDVGLYARPEQLHLDLVVPGGALTMGNVQLVVFRDRGRRILLVRAVNASASWVTAANATEILEAVLCSTVEMASNSDVDEVHFGEGMELWHLNSSRPEFRGLLDDLQDRLPVTTLERPLFVFHFAEIDRMLSRTYRLWPLPDALAARAGILGSTLDIDRSQACAALPGA